MIRDNEYTEEQLHHLHRVEEVKKRQAESLPDEYQLEKWK